MKIQIKHLEMIIHQTTISTTKSGTVLKHCQMETRLEAILIARDLVQQHRWQNSNSNMKVSSMETL